MANAARTTYREVFAEPVFRTLFLTRTLAITAGYAVECVAALALAVIAMPAAVSVLVVAGVAVLTPAFNGASARLIADRLTGDAYVVGRSVSNVASAGAQLVGLAAGGAAVALLGPRTALLLTAGAHLVGALGVRLFLPRLDRPSRGTGSAVAQSWTATRELLSDREVRRLALIQWLPPTFAVGAEALLIPYAAARHFPPSVTGLLLAAVPLGMLTSGVLVGRLVRPAGRERLVAPLIASVGVGILILVLPAPLPVALAALFVVGFSFAYSAPFSSMPSLYPTSSKKNGMSLALHSSPMRSVQACLWSLTF